MFIEEERGRVSGCGGEKKEGVRARVCERVSARGREVGRRRCSKEDKKKRGELASWCLERAHHRVHVGLRVDAYGYTPRFPLADNVVAFSGPMGTEALNTYYCGSFWPEA